MEVYHVDINGTIIGCDSTDPNASIEDAAADALSRSVDVNGMILTDNNTQSYYEWLKENYPKTYKKEAYNVITTFPQHKESLEKLIHNFNQGLFRSFVNLLETKIHKRNALLVFRTFGHDGDKVLADINANRDDPINFIKCDVSDLTFEKYQECILSETHILVQDNYKFWNTNGRSVKFGKVIQSYPGIVQYGFDDNDCMYPLGEDVTFIKINTLRAALEEDYFLNLLQ
ncbi:Hypothetical protein HVR_LOCUS1128 [uncultured virus]|nr:Hypothetical protein HVR_LOCUS1128 [uncultured virus]